MPAIPNKKAHIRDTSDAVRPGGTVMPVPEDLLQRLHGDVEKSGGEASVDTEMAGAIGATMFDLPASEDNTITVLLPKENVQKAPSQALVRIKSCKDGDGRNYLGIVTAGPFAEPDSLRADSHMLVTVATRGGIYMPPYHGRVQVAILGEELADGTLVPPRLRPLPNSPVFPLTEAEAAAVLRADGDLRLGLVVGYKDLVASIPSDQKSVLPRHTALLGTTGGGKSNTMACVIQQAQAAGMAVILLDVEGEYTYMHEPADNGKLLLGLKDRGLEPAGLPMDKTKLYYLVNRETANPAYKNKRQFSLQFARISPFAAIEILDLSEAQQTRFLKAYDIAKEVMRDLGIFPARGDREQELVAIELDEFERGYPRMTLSLLIDVVGACLDSVDKSTQSAKKKGDGEDGAKNFSPFNAVLKTEEGRQSLNARIHASSIPPNSVSWRGLLSKLWRLNRLKVFYNEKDGVAPLNYKELLRPGQVSVVDLSDSGASALNNLVIADLLRGVQEAQDEAYQKYEAGREKDPNAPPPTPVLIIIEEAHEFLSTEKIDRMNILFEQVARIAKRGRKRWLGLVFVTQLPQHLPRQVFGLVNSFILHKISDPLVVQALKKMVPGIDEGLWNKLPGLVPGQAIVSFPHMARPLLVSVDPAPVKLRMID
jgi:DNA helicase HerA-like ATPase